MIVYRIEHPETNRGPYHGQGFGGPLSFLCDAHDGDADHPTPQWDGIDNFTSNHVCGFKSLSDLKLWFKGYLPEIFHHGWKVYRINIPEKRILFGEKQIAFEKEYIISQRIVRISSK